MKFKLNNKGQFSIIAALLVTVVLVASVMTTYSAIRYSPVENQPQILSAIDETNVALKQVLGFTVGYYGSVLQITGNQTYAQQLATNYLSSGLANAAEIRPEWGASFNITSLKLNTNWYTNESYSQGTIVVNYNLDGLGISGVSYSTSTRLDVSIEKANSTSHAQLQILKDDGTPLINLGSANLKFYQYAYGNLTWGFTVPTNITSYADGTYVIDLPPGVTGTSYAIQVQDTRGLMVVASSFSQFTSTLDWNFTSVPQYTDFVDNASLTVVGTHSNFTAQQYGPDSGYDTLTEAASGNVPIPSYPVSYNMQGSTTLVSGTLNDLQSNNDVDMSFQSYPNSFSGSANFGYNVKGGSSNTLNYVRGSQFTMGTSGGLASSISAYLGFTGTSGTFGNTNTGSSGSSIMDTIRGQRFTTPSSPVVAQSISAYIYCATSAKNMKASIYDSNGNLVSITEEKSIPAGSTAWQTFNFATPPTLLASTNYVLVIWSQSGTGSADLRYSSATGGNGRFVSQTYGDWASPVTFATSANQYSIYCSYLTTFNVQAAIYSGTGGALIGSTEEKTLSTVNGWVTFNFVSQPILTASTNYVLAIETSDTSVNIYYDNGGTYYRATVNYPTWPASLNSQGNREYSIYCTYSPANQYTASIEFTGNSNTPAPWNDLIWAIEGRASVGNVAATFQLYNWGTGQYSSSGDGFMSGTLGTTDLQNQQTISANMQNFINSSGYWKINVTAVKSTATPFDLNLDLVQYSPEVNNYALNLQEQWTNINVTNLCQDLCIKTGSMSAEPLMVQVYHAGSWMNLTTLLPNFFNNVSLAPYIDSPNLTIRFTVYNDTADTVQDSWNIDAVYVKPERDLGFLLNLQDSTFTLEVLQNGTMRWLGQNLQLTTQTLPIPPIPVKAIHVNETISGVSQEVPFQIEDWASDYQIPLGLTSNETVFSNRQMVVFLLNNKVADFTVWWNGSDTAVQTSFAFTNKYFHDSTNTLSNGYITLGVSTDSAFTVTSQVVGKSTSSTANFMRINTQASTYGAGSATVICNGTVRDIIQQEAEWSGGATNCPNLYANIILTLPANASYYTYQLRIMFINSTQARTITDLTPLKLTTATSSVQTQTENSTFAGLPLVQNGTATFSNFGGVNDTAHHWTQLIADPGKGAGIMFTEVYNQKLYAFDSVAGAATGDLNVNSANRLIELSPVDLAQVSFKYAYDITWQGAVATFDGNTPICSLYDGTTPMGLWILAEYPPTLTVTAKS